MNNFAKILSIVFLLFITVQSQPQKVVLWDFEVLYQECIEEYIQEFDESDDSVKKQFTDYENTHSDIQYCSEFYERKQDQQNPINEEDLEISDLVQFYYCKKSVFFDALRDYGRGTLQYKIYFCDLSKVEQQIQKIGHNLEDDIDSITQKNDPLNQIIVPSDAYRKREGDYLNTENLYECMDQCEIDSCENCTEQIEAIAQGPCKHVQRLQDQNVETGFSNQNFISKGISDLMKHCFNYMKSQLPSASQAAQIVQCKSQCIDDQISSLSN